MCNCGCYDPLANSIDSFDPEGCCLLCPRGIDTCFPGESRLLLDNGQTVEMKHLRAGQRILTGKSSLVPYYYDYYDYYDYYYYYYYYYYMQSDSLILVEKCVLF